MPISSTTLVPEFQYYTNKLIIDTVLNKNLIPFSSPIDVKFLNDNKSFIRLLFDNDWPQQFTNYRYLYRKELLNVCPPEVRTRLMINPMTARYYVCDSDDSNICNVNLFDLESDDLMMLDKLLEYRLDSTSVVSINVIFNDLISPLAKLIYIYLNLKINNDYSLYDSSVIYSYAQNPLQNFYELYVVEQIFNTISSKGI